MRDRKPSAIGASPNHVLFGRPWPHGVRLFTLPLGVSFRSIVCRRRRHFPGWTGHFRLWKRSSWWTWPIQSSTEPFVSSTVMVYTITSGRATPVTSSQTVSLSLLGYREVEFTAPMTVPCHTTLSFELQRALLRTMVRSISDYSRHSFLRANTW